MQNIFEKTLEQVRKYYGIAGCGFVVVKDGKVLAKECFGLADMKTNRPITTKSFFDIASCSKAFTTFMVAQLCDEGKMDWDKPVVNYYPDFKMYDKYAEKNITARDMACHRSGLSRHDLVRRAVLTDRKDYVSRIEYYVPSCGFREKMQYQNQIYAALGYIAEQVDGHIWEDMIINRVARPLNMDIGFRGISDLKGLDAALPHLNIDGKPCETTYNMCSANNPCGGIKTNLDSIEHWITMLSAGGIYDGKRMISEKQFNEIKTPVVYVGECKSNKNDKNGCYSLGWMPSIYKGRRLVAHGGSIQGFNSSIGFLPDDNAAYAFFTNTGETPICNIFEYLLTDYIFNELEEDYGYLIDGYVERAKISAEKAKNKHQKQAISKEEIDINIGKYYNAGYHTIEIIKNNIDGLMVSYANNFAEIYKNEDGIYRGEFEELEIPAEIKFAEDGKSAIMSFSSNYSPTYFERIK